MILQHIVVFTGESYRQKYQHVYQKGYAAGKKKKFEELSHFLDGLTTDIVMYQIKKAK